MIVNLKHKPNKKAEYDVEYWSRQKGNYFVDKKYQYRSVFENNFETLEEYVDHLFRSGLIYDVIKELDNKNLGCFCTGKKCHAVILRKLLTECKSLVEKYCSLEKKDTNETYLPEVLNKIIYDYVNRQEIVFLDIKNNKLEYKDYTEKEFLKCFNKNFQSVILRLRTYDIIVISGTEKRYLKVPSKNDCNYINITIDERYTTYLPYYIGNIFDFDGIDINYFQDSLFNDNITMDGDDEENKRYDFIQLNFLTSKIGNEISQLYELLTKKQYCKLLNERGLPLESFNCGKVSDKMSFIQFPEEESPQGDWENIESFYNDMDKEKYKYIVKSDYLYKLIKKIDRNEVLVAKILKSEEDKSYVIILESINKDKVNDLKTIEIHGTSRI